MTDWNCDHTHGCKQRHPGATDYSHLEPFPEPDSEPGLGNWDARYRARVPRGPHDHPARPTIQELQAQADAAIVAGELDAASFFLTMAVVEEVQEEVVRLVVTGEPLSTEQASRTNDTSSPPECKQEEWVW